MSFFNRLLAVILSCLLLGPMTPVEARTKKGDKFFAEGKLQEARKEFDAALESFEKALSEDPTEPIYQATADKARNQASQFHVENGMTVRAKGQLGDALLEFQKAYAIAPGSVIALQELQETQQMVLRERKRVEDTGKEAAPEIRALTPGEAAEKAGLDKIDRMLPIPELRSMAPGLIDLKMTGKIKVVFETLGKYARINVLWDPEFTAPTHDNFTVDFDNATLDQALNYICEVSKTYFKVLSANTIIVTNDSPNKRRDYEEQVMKTFYLHNISGTTEMQEIVNAVRTLPELTKVFQDNEQYAIVVRGEADKVALAEKIVHDLDKPRPEVLLDILVVEASTTFNKQLTAAIASTGLNVPVAFTPRSSIQVQGNNTTTSSTTSSTSTTTSTTTTPTSTTTGSTGTSSSVTGASIPLSSLGHLASADFSTTLPGALLAAVMSDAKTTVLQAPELRAVDNIKSSLNIGEREPTASGSFQPGVGGVGINPLVNTQFNYIDIGVNVEVNCRVHSDEEVSISMLLNLTSVTGQVNLGGINQPIIGQRKIQHDFRLRAGEAAIIGGLVTRQDDKTITGIPGLSSIPLLGNLFKGSTVDHNKDDVIIVVIPHILRKPQFTDENMRAIAVGTQSVKISYAPLSDGATPASAGDIAKDFADDSSKAVPVEKAPAAPATPTFIRPAPQPLGQQPPAGVPSINQPSANLPSVNVPPAGLPPGVPGGPGVMMNAPPRTAPPMTAPPMTAPAMTGSAMAPPATAPPMTAPPATAPPMTAPPATAPPMTASPAAATTPKPVTAPGKAALRFAPSPVQTTNGGVFTVSLMVDNGADVTTAPVQIAFDPKVLKLNDIFAGDFLKQGGVDAKLTKNIQNDGGSANVLLNRPADAKGAAGSGTLLTLNFTAIGPGTAQVSAPNLSLRNATGGEVATGSPQLTVNVK